MDLIASLKKTPHNSKQLKQSLILPVGICNERRVILLGFNDFTPGMNHRDEGI